MVHPILHALRIERIDDVPLLLAHLKRMQVAALLDRHFPTHGNWAGELTFGEVACVWLAYLVSTGDHRLNRLQDWAAHRLELLTACLGKQVRPQDFHDDRLADMLDALQDPLVWAAFEQDLNCSTAHAQRQGAALEQRVARAVAAREAWNQRKRGKTRLGAAALSAAADPIVARHGVVGLVEAQVSTARTEVSKRKYKDRPAVVEVREQSRVAVVVNTAAVAAQKRLCGWRVYATNHPGLTLPAAVLSDRGQYGIEHDFARLKGKSLGLAPMYLPTDRRVAGLVHLLSIGLRVLTLVEYVVRRSLEADEEPLRGVYASQPGRQTRQPSAELLLEAFRGLDLQIVEVNGDLLPHRQSPHPSAETHSSVAGHSVRRVRRPRREVFRKRIDF